MADRRPMAFMSYAHIDDRLNRGYLTEFCECLSGEVCLHLGEEFPIFMDRKDIKWGDSWKKRIEESIDGTTFLIPIISPGFFKSQYCRDELSRFLEREKKLARDDLILPVYLIDTPLLENETKKNGDELAQIVASRQYADWRKLRFEELGSRDVRQALADLAAQIREAMDSLPPASEGHAPGIEPLVSVNHEIRPSATVSEEITEIRTPADTKPEPATIIVDQWHRGDFVTITDAIAVATPGSRILVHSGVYDEGLVIDKPLEIVGDGNLGDVILRAAEKNAVLFKATRGKISNMMLRQDAGGYCVDITQGCLELDGCDITSDSLTCVAVHGNAYPKIYNNKIHEGKGTGIYIFENGQGLFKDNEIYGNSGSGVKITESGNPLLNHNKIHDCRYGIYVDGNGRGLIEDNEIYCNLQEGIVVFQEGNPIVKHNTIHDGKSTGVSVYSNRKVIIEDNDIYGNESRGIDIGNGANPIIRLNRINKNRSWAIWLAEKSAGIIEDNDFRNNFFKSHGAPKDSQPLAKFARNLE